MEDVVTRLKEFLEQEARFCSMDPGCITSDYVYRMWGGQFSIKEIENGLKELWKQGFMETRRARNYGTRIHVVMD